MTYNDELADARRLFAEESLADYKITPTEHADQYQDVAPQLAAVLRSTTVATHARAYEDADRNAIAWQDKYKSHTSWANRLVAATAVLGATLAVLGSSAGGPGEPRPTALIIGLAVATAFIAGAAAFFIYKASQGRYLARWMSSRAEAETHRLAYFKAVTGSKSGAATEIEVRTRLLCLLYFLRHQLRVQLQYYRDRGGDHQKSAETNLTFAAIAAGIGVVTSALIGTLSVAGAGWLIAFFGIVTVLGSSLSGFASARESMNQDQRNAERYERTRKLLVELDARAGDVEAAIENGNADALGIFVDAVHDQLSLEHRQWLDDVKDTSAAIAKLDKALQSATTEFKAKDGKRGSSA